MCRQRLLRSLAKLAIRWDRKACASAVAVGDAVGNCVGGTAGKRFPGAGFRTAAGCSSGCGPVGGCRMLVLAVESCGPTDSSGACQCEATGAVAGLTDEGLS